MPRPLGEQTVVITASPWLRPRGGPPDGAESGPTSSWRARDEAVALNEVAAEVDVGRRATLLAGLFRR